MRQFLFSNFQKMEIPMVYDGHTYNTVENFYQAMKTTDKAIRARIASVSASEAKKMGRKLTIRPDWEDIKLKVMEYALKHKFQPGTTHYSDLVAYKGEIVEDNLWHDNYWGVCKCALLTQSSYGVKGCRNGKNHLGVLLMALRDQLIKEQQMRQA